MKTVGIHSQDSFDVRTKQRSKSRPLFVMHFPIHLSKGVKGLPFGNPVACSKVGTSYLEATGAQQRNRPVFFVHFT